MSVRYLWLCLRCGRRGRESVEHRQADCNGAVVFRYYLNGRISGGRRSCGWRRAWTDGDMADVNRHGGLCTKLVDDGLVSLTARTIDAHGRITGGPRSRT